jgi:outer membrane protein W
MKTIAILLLLLSLLAFPAAAQSTGVTLWLTSQGNEDGGRFAAGDTEQVRFDSGSGFGAGVSRMFARSISGELAIFRTSSSADVREGSEMLADLGDIELMPITAMVRYHFRPGKVVDVYAGAGAAYVSFDDLNSADLRAAGLAPVRIEDELTPAIGGGLLFSFGPRWGAAVDARYIPLEISARAAGDTDVLRTDLNPLLLSAGVRLRF